MTDPWAAGQAAMSGGGQQAASNGEGSSLGGSSLVPESQGLGGAGLFGGGKRRPGLFNRTHAAGTVRGGVIADIKDLQSSFHQREGGGLKYWPNGKSGKGTMPVKDAVGDDGKPNRPVMDTVFYLATDHRLTEQEAKTLEYDADRIATDDGERSWVVDEKAVRDAIEAFNAANGASPIAASHHLLGKRVEVRRLKEPGENGQAWAVRLTAV